MRPTVAEIDLSAVSFNIKEIKKRVQPAKIMAVVKANAYGHGALEICKQAIQSGVEYLGVACGEEGVAMRKAGVDAPILVFSSSGLNRTDPYLEYNLEATVFDEAGLYNLTQSARRSGKKAVVHVKVDTGMNRMGINWQQAPEFVEKVYNTPEIQVQGLYTHFANSDSLDKSFAILQLQRFKQVIARLEEMGIHVPLKHAANSGAILDLPDTYFDIVRPGILLYGYYPAVDMVKSMNLKPAMTFKTRVLYIKEIERGESVSYDRTFIADKKTLVASLPVGYGDGYNRLLSNNGQVLVGGKRYPIIGRVCMDLIMIDLLDNRDIKVGDEVILMGTQGGETISAVELADKSMTVPYEVLCYISERVQRVYINRDNQVNGFQ